MSNIKLDGFLLYFSIEDYDYFSRLFSLDEDFNLFKNNNFEDAVQGTAFTKDWSCQGDHLESLPMYRNSLLAKVGKFSGLCLNRDRKSQGPAQRVEGIVNGGDIYSIQGWTHLLNAKTLDEAASIELWLQYRSQDHNTHEKRLLAKRDKYINNTGWQFWNTQFRLPGERMYTFVLIFFQGPPKHVDIVIDKMLLQKLKKLENFKEYSDSEIERVRKRNVTVSISFEKYQYTRSELEETKLEIDQLSSEFGFGVSVDFHNLVYNKKYRSFIEHNFEWATMESAMKWDSMEKNKDGCAYFLQLFSASYVLIEVLNNEFQNGWQKGVVKFEDVEHMLDILRNQMGMLVRGHCVYWSLPENNPSWLLNLNKTSFKSSMNTRMRDVVWKFRRRFKHLDVNNEMLHGWLFSDHLKPTVRNWMFKAANHLDKDAKLFLNDFDVFASPVYTQSYIEQIRAFLKAGVPIHGIGVQGHFSGTVYPESLKERLDMLASTGLPIWITELDIKEDNENKRADILENILRIAYSHQSVEGILLWTFWDKHAWRGNHTSLFDGDNFLPNAVGRRYLSLRDQWKYPFAIQKPTKVTENEVTFNFRAFHGAYNLKVVLPDRQVIERSVAVENHWKPLLVQFKTHVKYPT